MAENRIRKRNMPQDIAIQEAEGETRQQALSRIISAGLDLRNKRGPNTDEAVEACIEKYFDNCSVQGMHPSVEGLALCLGIARQTLFDWECGKRGPARADIIKKAKEFIAYVDACLANEGKINVVHYIFRAKNYYGLADKQEMVLTPNTGGDVQSAQELEKRYLAALPDGE